eukprot:SAG11_NODE_204_length_12459_cov_6.526133_9_plen_106_part_00
MDAEITHARDTYTRRRVVCGILFVALARKNVLLWIGYTTSRQKVCRRPPVSLSIMFHDFKRSHGAIELLLMRPAVFVDGMELTDKMLKDTDHSQFKYKGWIGSSP